MLSDSVIANLFTIQVPIVGPKRWKDSELTKHASLGLITIVRIENMGVVAMHSNAGNDLDTENTSLSIYVSLPSSNEGRHGVDTAIVCR